MHRKTDTEQSADEIVRRIRAGESRLFAELVRRYQGDVWRRVASLLRDRDATESLAQQVFVNAYQSLGQYRGGGFGSWLIAIASNLVRMEFRRRSREGERLRQYEAHLMTLLDGEKLDEHDQDMERAVKACRETLAPAAAQALTLYYDESLGLDEVAVQIGRSTTATRQLLFRTRVALRACVDRRMASA